MEATDIKGTLAVLCPPGGPKLGSEQDALDLMAAGYEQDARLIVVPVERMAPDFFTLRNGILGAFLQKLSNYRCRVAFVGDLAERIAQSKALNDFVYESNKGRDVLFVRDPRGAGGATLVLRPIGDELHQPAAIDEQRCRAEAGRQLALEQPWRRNGCRRRRAQDC